MEKATKSTPPSFFIGIHSLLTDKEVVESYDHNTLQIGLHYQGRLDPVATMNSKEWRNTQESSPIDREMIGKEIDYTEQIVMTRLYKNIQEFIFGGTEFIGKFKDIIFFFRI